MHIGQVLYSLRIAGQTLPMRTVQAKTGNFYAEVRTKRADGEISGARGVKITALADKLPTMATLLDANGAEVLTLALVAGFTTPEEGSGKAPRAKVSGTSKGFESAYGEDRVLNVQISHNPEDGTWYLFQCGVRGQGGGGSKGPVGLDSL